MNPRTAVLVIGGLPAVVIGSALLLAPSAIHRLNGTELGADASLLSEVRAPGGALLAVGVLMLAGAFVPALARSATIAGAVVFGAYGLSRVLSMAVDGRPAAGLVVATVVEILLGAACTFVLLRERAQEIEAIGGPRGTGTTIARMGART